MDVFMDDFSVFGNSFSTCLSNLEKMLKRCEDTNHCLNWEKSHFIVKEGIVLGHKISKNRIEVDKAKVDVIAKLPYPTTIKGNGDPPVPDLRTMDDLCQPSLNGRGGPISSISIQATNFGLKNDMIQQLQNSCQFHGLPGDDVNKHLDKFLHVTQSIKVNGVTDDALRLLTLRHRDTINAVAGGTFMKRRPEECYDLIKNMIAHHNDWDTSAKRSESSSSITSSFDPKIIALKAKMAKINKNLMRVLQ
nr:reverse transcriptase domain-containing protein [Tanacetum cinerariifolium]